MDPDAALIRLAVFGSPIKHSLSPRIHAMFADQAGLEVEYRSIETNETFLSREIQALADAGGRGCNITLPLKHHAYRLASQASQRARVAEAANTLRFETRHRWVADNTDGRGLVRDLNRWLAGVRPAQIAVIGAGGATAGILFDLLNLDPERLVLFNRTLDRAQALAARFAEFGPIGAKSLDEMGSAGPFDLVIHASSATHHGGQPLIDPGLFGPGARCYDLNYGDAHAGLSSWSDDHGVPCRDGLGMLVEQAALSFALWTGFEPATAPVLESLRKT